MQARFLIALMSVAAQAAVIDGNATVTTLKGSAKVDAKDASQGSLVLNGQHISTEKDSSVILWLSNGSRLVLNPKSVVLLKQLKQEEGSVQQPNPEDKSQKETGPSITEIEVESGKVIGDVKKLAPMSVFTLKTPVGTVTIKGTVFSVEYKKNDDGTVAFNIGCLVGRVTVQMADPKVAPISVPAGKQLTISAPAPQPPAGGDKPAPAKEGDKPDAKGEQPAPPPPPPMKVEMAPLPPKEMAAIRIADVPPPPPPPPPAVQQNPVDKVIDAINKMDLKDTINMSPTGG